MPNWSFVPLYRLQSVCVTVWVVGTMSTPGSSCQLACFDDVLGWERHTLQESGTWLSQCVFKLWPLAMIKFGLCCGIWRANISRYIGLSIYWSGSSFHSHSICLVSWIHFCVSSDTWTRCCLTNTFSCLLDVCLISHAIQTFLIAVFLRLRPCSINPA